MITVPATLDDARSRCAALEGLAQASGWERAAIVWAFTEKAKAGRPPRQGSARHGENLTTSIQISLIQFAELGLPGLTSRITVTRYHDAWQYAIDQGWTGPAVPGRNITIPVQPWPPLLKALDIEDPDERQAIIDEADDAGIRPNVVAHVAEQPGAIAAAIKANPRIAAKAREALEVVEDRKRQERDHAAVAKGGRVKSLDEVNGNVGTRPLDGMVARLDTFEDGLRLIEQGRAKLAELGILTEAEQAKVRDAALALLDLFLSAETVAP